MQKKILLHYSIVRSCRGKRSKNITVLYSRVKSFTSSNYLMMPDQDKDFKDMEYSSYSTEEIGGKAREKFESCDTKREAQKACDKMHSQLISENGKLMQEVEFDTNQEIRKIQESNSISLADKEREINNLKAILADDISEFSKLLVQQLKIVNESLNVFGRF